MDDVEQHALHVRLHLVVDDADDVVDVRLHVDVVHETDGNEHGLARASDLSVLRADLNAHATDANPDRCC